MILEFPWIVQSTNYTCGSACMTSILNYYGFDEVTEDEMSDELKSAPVRGTRPESFIRVAKKYGLNANSVMHTSINNIIQSIINHNPVIVNVQAWSDSDDIDYTENYNNGHYVVAIGFQDDKIIFADPSCLYRTFLTLEELERRWHDKETEEEYTDHLAIFFVGKPDFSYSKIKHMN